jgi:hypothetical protein
MNQNFMSFISNFEIFIVIFMAMFGLIFARLIQIKHAIFKFNYLLAKEENKK